MDQTISDFIRGTFLGTYKEISEKYHYIAFSLIFSGIELLGKCLDETVEFEYYNSSNPSKYFNDGLLLLGTKYQDLELYKYCRNGFAHCVKPSIDSKVGLAKRPEGNKIPNLSKIRGLDKKVLFIDNFYEDFANACNIVLQKIENKELTHAKLSSVFLPVRNYEIED